ncbi:MAG: phosphoenolpyruvate carboxylase [Candidatus Brocadia carolinensis]|uniref:Phosphoenolpyruvate carboxylase n=1 Tax=Candidatus Brocadia carolinensis TaxID=1004156 RepID=A0A1V4AU91_9BACT|nr:MAG: phosphoenolpyruvate carboxylase [Candidatus Brocadia caroliniensis]
MRKIPRTMSTQHPDNITMPFFTEGTCFLGEDEIKEAYYVFSHLRCDEQMWDCEGKEVDEFVIKKLLTRYDNYFKNNRIGKDCFITLRVPNPMVEKSEAKILLETLESAPRSYDTANQFYGTDNIPPIFEVILPMTTSAEAINRVYYYYRDFVVGKQHKRCFGNDITIKEWIGEFKPETIEVIPLFEDIPYMLSADTMVESYLKDKQVSYQRVFLGRSDPALNYGMLSAILVAKIALQRLHLLQERIRVPVYPILGLGSNLFRGNLSPLTVDECLKEYPSVQTFTVQSAFKYDYDEGLVTDAIRKIHSQARTGPVFINEEMALDITERLSSAYRGQMKELAPLINEVARFVPKRRMRKLHIGLFGYSRSIEGITLPRVISFCASLYSIGLPPELLGLHNLTEKDLGFLKSAYPSFLEDLSLAASYYNGDVKKLISPKMVKDIEKVLGMVKYTENLLHSEYTSHIIQAVLSGKKETVPENVIAAGKIRRFLG